MELSVYKSTSWKILPWDQFRRKVFSLQCRIYDAMRDNDIQQTIKFQKCLINSSSSHYLAIKECTEFNVGKKISGTDENLIPTLKDKLLFAYRIREEMPHWKFSPHRKIKILLDNGEETFFSIPTIEDRIIQFIWKLALEPAHEAIFSHSSYGFRPGRTLWDMQKGIINNLNPFYKRVGKKILIFDFSQYSRLIKHNLFLNKLVFPFKYKTGIYQALKMGILNEMVFPFSYHYSLTTLSFLLLNIAFHGLEDLSKNNIVISDKVYGFRYGAHLLYMFDQDERIIYSLIDNFFYTMGVNFNYPQASINKSLDNFDFLGLCFVIKPNGKILNYPTKINWIIHKSEIKHILKNPVDTIAARLTKIGRKMNRWYKYHHLCNISEVSWEIYSLRNWVNRYLRLHTSMGKQDRYILLTKIFTRPF